ncbi:class I SAM-dependent methyltransferase [Candidatus Berkiella aquae]|uniref:Ribosomal RNA small subunit methyltransferase J n=1 Tax=Candidatus Berkiella aquae TaxID=295108 RepID=A0A0Q9YFV2_9GAMM|nr:class I SAM-dependent methyltransferase [Candidatus Berkiella aquae]MCS5709832.1 class I SAM-dependent methyltransferase [Candidatus Berkiella aquae]
MRVDFADSRLRYRLQHLQGTNELIAKAIGLKKNGPCTVFDTTAGLGKESFLMAALGCEVTLFERNPTVAASLQEGLLQAKNQPDLAPIIARMHFKAMCAIQYLRDNPQVTPAVIYCDPMFPGRTKSALVKKEMQWLQTLVNPDEDSETLIELSLTRATQRVVVKRPVNAPWLIRKPDFDYRGRSHRFDVYILHPAPCSKPASCNI